MRKAFFAVGILMGLLALTACGQVNGRTVYKYSETAVFFDSVRPTESHPSSSRYDLPQGIKGIRNVRNGLIWLIKDTEVSLAAGVGAVVLILAATFVFSVRRREKQEALVGEIVRYSENYLRSCINEALYNKADIADLMDHSVGTVVLKKVVNTEDTTEITVRVHVSEICLPEGKKPYTKKIQKILTLQRARYPERRKVDGSFFTEKSCPSCGANFIPDEKYCCSFCGYGLKVNNAK